MLNTHTPSSVAPDLIIGITRNLIIDFYLNLVYHIKTYFKLDS